MINEMDKIVGGLEQLARLNAIEREFLTLALRGSTLLAAGDVAGARALMGRMESLHREVKEMKVKEMIEGATCGK
jgi:hypothetical protein